MQSDASLPSSRSSAPLILFASLSSAPAASSCPVATTITTLLVLFLIPIPFRIDDGASSFLMFPIPSLLDDNASRLDVIPIPFLDDDNASGLDMIPIPFLDDDNAPRLTMIPSPSLHLLVCVSFFPSFLFNASTSCWTTIDL